LGKNPYFIPQTVILDEPILVANVNEVTEIWTVVRKSLAKVSNPKSIHIETVTLLIKNNTRGFRSASLPLHVQKVVFLPRISNLLLLLPTKNTGEHRYCIRQYKGTEQRFINQNQYTALEVTEAKTFEYQMVCCTSVASGCT
jgi:hypothetical protein